MDRSTQRCGNGRPRISWLLLLLIPWLWTCSGQPGVLLDIGSWPEQADSLRIDGTLNGVPFTEPLSIPGRPTRFVVYVPEGNSGQLNLTITALGSDGCPRAGAGTQVEIGNGLRRVAEARVMMTPVAPPYCPAPALDRISPTSGVNSDATTVTITGGGFRAGARVTVGDMQCNVLTVSSTQITCSVPARAATCGAQPVVVTNPEDSRAATGAMFSYRPAQVVFGPIVILSGGGTGQRQLVAADFNNDGKLDLASVNFSSNNVSVYLNNGNRSFGSANNLSVGTGPVGLAAGDLNKDGRQDLVVTNAGSSDISFLAGDGMGGFATAVNTGGLSGPQGVALGDIDNDGKLDVVVSNNGASSVSVFAGNGAGGLAARTSVSTGSSARYLTLGDINRDGKLDLVIPNIVTHNISIRKGRGDATLTFETGGEIPVGMAPVQAVIIDVNGDQNPDILVANQNSSSVTVLLGDGKDTFSPAEGSPLAVGSSPQILSVADMDGDGKPDIVTTNFNNGNVSILAGTGTGQFLPIAGSPFAAGMGPFGLTTRDLDGDGLSDLAISNLNAGNTVVRFAVCN